MGFREMLEWWNLIYLLPLFVSIVWLIGSVVFGGAEAQDHDVSTDAAGFDHDVDVDMDADVDADVHGHGGSALDIGPDLGRGSNIGGDLHDDNALIKVLGILGVGKVPITMLIGAFMLIWGVVGYLTNRVLSGVLVYPLVYIWPSIAITFIISGFATRLVAEGVAKIMPGTETYGTDRIQLVGRLGKTVFKVTSASGTVDISDQYGTIHRVQARTGAEDTEIPSGTQVVVVDYDDSDKRFIIERSTL